MLQYNLPVLVFAILALIKLRQSVEATMLDVFFPVLLVMPAVYFLHIPHIPRISCYDAVLFPLGIAALIKRRKNWRLRRSDLWVIGFAAAGFYTDYLNLGMSTALYNFLEPGFLGGMLAYFIGKLLIEQSGNREVVSKRIVVLLTAVSLISVSEFLTGHNLLLAATNKFFGLIDYWGDQYRYGFDRVKGPFMGPEGAGIMFLMGFFFSLWIWYLNRSRKHNRAPESAGLRRPLLYAGSILMGLIMTLSRGPELGTFAGYLIARAGLVKRRRLAIFLAVAVIGTGFVVAHRRAVALEAIANEASQDESKASATYRTRLYDVYEPMAEAGGLFGWSASAYQKASVAFPETIYYGSIDNEYLLLWVTQGKVGLLLFILIAAEAGFALAKAIRYSQQPSDICFYYCLAGILVGVLIVLSTVFLAGQAYIMFFLINGWIQSLSEPKKQVPVAPRLALRRVFT